MNAAALELKCPPPLVAFVAGLLINRTAAWWPVLGLPGWRWLMVAALVAAASALALAALWRFRHARTTIHPHRPDETSSLVCDGVYRFSRNPMYLAMALLLTAYVVVCGQWLAVVWVAAFVAYITRFQIVPEERALRHKFGRTYAAYLAATPRWIGRLRPVDDNSF